MNYQLKGSELVPVLKRQRGPLTQPPQISGRPKRRSLLKRFTMRFSRPTSPWSFLLPSSQIHWEREVGDGTRSSTVMAPLWWLMRAFPEAPVQVLEKVEEGDWEPVPDHPMAEKIESPNRFYSGTAMWMATVLELVVCGNGYWLLERGNALEIQNIWWVPSWTMRAVTPDDGSALISHYEYRPRSRETQIVLPEDVVHFRYGLDPDDQRYGLSPLASVLREVFTDDEAANYTASLLRNMGVPGLMVSPEGEVAASDEDLLATKRQFKESFTGDRRGEPFIATGPTRVTQFGFNPQEMNLKDIRRIPEERVTAVLGVPAIVAGLGAGLDRSTFANMKEAREMAYETTIVPLQKLVATDLKNQLLLNYEPDPMAFKVAFDLTDVRVLQEDENARVERLVKELQAGAITVAEYRRETGRETGPEHDVYLRPISLTEIPAGARAPLPVEEPPSQPPEEDLQGVASRLGGGAKNVATESRFIEAVKRDAEHLESVFEGELLAAFDSLGAQAEGLARSMGLTGKASEIDERVAAAMLAGLGIESWKERALGPAYEKHYLRTLEQTVSTGNAVLGVTVDIPDHVAREIVRTGGKRLGLLDIKTDTRIAIFNALADGREAGEGVDAMARRIRKDVSAGRWRHAGPRYRAQLIARTETKYAQNVSTINAYKDSGVVTGLRAYDAQGATSDPECISRDGLVFTFEDADSETAKEHPNGTLSWAPVTREEAGGDFA